jgi:hypothetical protein
MVDTVHRGIARILRGLATAWLALTAAVGSAAYFPVYSTWPQPAGPGSPIVLSYSFSNLLDGSIIDSATGSPFSSETLRGAFEAALRDYAAILPISFVEMVDSGPMPETGSYDPKGLANIRIGQVPSIDDANAYAYFPNPNDGLGGDIVFNAGRFGFDWTLTWFYAVAQHELGHSLGMGHEAAGEPPASFAQGAGYNGPIIPLTFGMITALQGAYGPGTGTVTPLAAIPEPSTTALLAAGVALVVAWRQRLLARS